VDDVHLQEFFAMNLPHPKDDQNLFTMIRQCFLYAIFCPKETQIFFNEEIRNLSIRHLKIKPTSDNDNIEMEYDSDVPESKVADPFEGLLIHSEKLVANASLRIMEKKLLSLSKRICTKCGSLSDTSYKCCANCKFVWYCSLACQKGDWKVHKVICEDSKLFAILDESRRSKEMSRLAKQMKSLGS